MKFYHNTKYPIGLDISDLTLRFVQFKGQGRRVKLHAFNKIDVPAGYFDRGKIINIEGVKKIITKLLETSQGNRIIGKNLIISLPEDKSFIKIIETSFLKKEEILPILKKEAEKHIPLSFEELYYDWQIIKTEKENNKMLILFGAAPKEIINKYNEVFLSLGYSPLVYEIESVALARALIDVRQENKISSIIVDIGFDRATFVIFDQGTIQYAASTNDISGNGMTELLSRNLQIYPKRAEQIKRKYGITHKTEASLLPFLNNLKNRLDDVISFCRDHCTSHRELNQIIMCGGVSNTRYLNDYLINKYNFNVMQGDPWINLPSLKKQKKIPSDQIMSYVTAIGLAMRSVLIKEYV